MAMRLLLSVSAEYFNSVEVGLYQTIDFLDSIERNAAQSSLEIQSDSIACLGSDVSGSF